MGGFEATVFVAFAADFDAVSPDLEAEDGFFVFSIFADFLAAGGLVGAALAEGFLGDLADFPDDADFEDFLAAEAEAFVLVFVLREAAMKDLAI
ncbi:MAG: hypothetical protein IPK83_07060 [Planctomycetes bacterium]|nr:hypothetical protein [Planctomycetota bacterium]